MYDILLGVVQHARAIAIDSDEPLAGWDMTCHGEGAICTFIATGATTIIARFNHPR